jgi:hypothetical protein
MKFLMRDRVPFRCVVEREQAEAYARVVGDERLLLLPESGNGLIYSRNWIRDHAESEGHDRHWQFDDNIGQIRRLYAGQRIPCESGPAIRSVEDFVDRFENVALAGLNYQMFVTPTSPPYRKNVHVYSATLVNHEFPDRWRLLYNDDTDLCLLALASGKWTTVLVNLFMIDKKTTMTVKGGNTDAGGPINYQGEGRLRMARVLEKAWPGIVTTDWRYGRAAHVIDWTQFRTPLRLRDGVEPSTLDPVDEYGLTLVERRPVADPKLRQLLTAYHERRKEER